MPAVSGSPTQVRSSVVTANDLAGVPDDAFAPGDLAYVSSLHPNATFRLRRVPHVGPYDMVTAIPTWSGNGYWELFPLGGGGGGGLLQIDSVLVSSNGQTAFTLPLLPVIGSEVQMFVNGILCTLGVDYTVVGVNVTWLNTPFVLQAGVNPDRVTFAYQI